MLFAQDFVEALVDVLLHKRTRLNQELLTPVRAVIRVIRDVIKVETLVLNRPV